MSTAERNPVTTPTPISGSKPENIKALRATWRRSGEHFIEQLKRFFRLAVLAALPSLLDLLQGGKFDYKTLLAFIVPFLEVAYREVFPALGAAAADAAPGVTIVPEQVGVAPLAPAPEAVAVPVPVVEAQPAASDVVDLSDIPLDLAA